MSEPMEEESERRWDELFARSPEVLERMAEEALREHREGKTLPVEDSDCVWVYDPTVETLETFLGDSLNRAPRTPEEIAEIRELAKTDPSMAAALSLHESGGLDVEAILELRRWRIRDDFRLFHESDA